MFDCKGTTEQLVEKLVCVAGDCVIIGRYTEATIYAEQAFSIANAIINSEQRDDALLTFVNKITEVANIPETTSIAELAFIAADSINFFAMRELAFRKIIYQFNIAQLHSLRVMAAVRLLITAKNPWSQFDVLLHVAESSAINILQLLK